MESNPLAVLPPPKQPAQAGQESNSLSLAWRYGLVLPAVAAAMALTWLARDLGSAPAFGPFYLAVLACAWYGGLGPGIVAVVLAALVNGFVFMPPTFSLTVRNAYILQTAMFIMVTLILVWLTTSRRYIDGLLRQEREQYRVTLTSIGDAVIVTDPAGRVIFMNGVAQALTGWSTEEAYGQPLEQVFRIVNEFTRAAVDNPARRVIDSGQVVGLANHTLLITRPGREVPIDDSAAPVQDGDGQILGVVLVFRDITERRQAQQAAEQAAERTARLQQVTAALSAAVTPDQVAGVIMEEGIQALGAHSGAVMLLRPDGQALEIIKTVGYSEPALAGYKQFPLTASIPAAEVARTGEPLWIDANPTLLARYPHLAGVPLRTHNQAIAMLPLTVQARRLGVINWAFAEKRVFSPEEQEFLLTLARQCAQALERARLYELEQQARQAAQAEVDIRRQTEEKLHVSLQEKEILLHEINHRVKNNLMAVSNLIYLQAQTIPDPQVRQKFTDTQDRIKSIALIHEKLYQARNFTRLDFADYAQSLVDHLVQSYRIRPEQIRVAVTSDDLNLGVDTVVTLGIIVNELVSNALKHAFPAHQSGQIDISLRADAGGGLKLTVADNGVGFPAGQELSTITGSLGLQLVQMLADHLRGAVELAREGGTRFTISLKPLVEAG